MVCFACSLRVAANPTAPNGNHQGLLSSDLIAKDNLCSQFVQTETASQREPTGGW